MLGRIFTVGGYTFLSAADRLRALTSCSPRSSAAGPLADAFFRGLSPCPIISGAIFSRKGAFNAAFVPAYAHVRGETR